MKWIHIKTMLKIIWMILFTKYDYDQRYIWLGKTDMIVIAIQEMYYEKTSKKI